MSFNPDPLPPHAQAFEDRFWDGLTPVGRIGACPECGAGALPVRQHGRGPHAEHYVRHCGRVLRVLLTAQVAPSTQNR